MNLQISDEQQLLVDSFAKLFAVESTTARVRAAEPLGYDPALWRELAAMGAPMMRVPETAGGTGASLLDAILVAEQAGKYLASAPLVECIVAARLLSECGHSEADRWLQGIRDGKALVSLALRPADAGSLQLVPGGAVADAVLVRDGNTLTLFTRASKKSATQNLGSIPLGEWDFTRGGQTEALVLARGSQVPAAVEAALEEWKLLTAAMLAGLSRQALDIAAAYARERTAFGRPIGSFQGLAHPLADSVTAVEGAMLLARKAAWALARGNHDAAALISMASFWSADATGTATLLAMRVLGGYGMAMDYDAQLYYRRGRACSLVNGDPQLELRNVGERLWGGAEVVLPKAGDMSLEFGYGAAAEKLMSKMNPLLDKFFTPEMARFCHESTDMFHPEFQRGLGAEQLLYPNWPTEYGGQGCDPYAAAAVNREIGKRGWTSPVMETNNQVGLILIHCASEEIRNEILPGVATGETNFAMGYTEPSGGSDVFAAKTRAVRDGDDWIINGQKMFTTQGHLAKYCLLLARTAPELPKHAGLTLFIAPIDRPGFEAHRVDTIGNERTNITHYTNLRVPDRYRVGEVNGGVKAMSVALTLEHSGGGLYVISIERILRHALGWAKTAGRDGNRPIDNPEVRMRIAQVQTRFEVFLCLSGRSLWAGAENVREKAYGPMAKLFGSETWMKCSADLMDLTAPDSLLRNQGDLGTLELESRRAIPGTIYGGTSEVQRSIIAESALGLPRSRT